jgi:pimeloyl-ACP methyl ester carboxylesterase
MLLTPLVILHGWGHSASHWRQVAQLWRDREVISIDLPGFGCEPLHAGDWGIPEYARWVEAKLTARMSTMQEKRFILLGHSFGGRVAAEIASRQPSWLSHLVLVGAPCLYRPSQKVRILKRIAKVVKILGAPMIPWSLNPELTDADKKGLGTIYRTVVTYDQKDALTRIVAPTLIIHGSLDTYPDAQICSAMHKSIQKSELLTLAGMGHNIHLESPTLLYGVVQKWLTKMNTTSSTTQHEKTL